jgi:peptidoglycan/LPS O-acetylase OafA/YrhL
MEPSNSNNFDGLRLLAALQVLFIHASEHLHLVYSSYFQWFVTLIGFFPGVPVFFTISGFLITWSYERNKKQLLKFYRNRFIRIFPALWMCVFITIFVLLIVHILTPHQLFSKVMIAWCLAQLSVFQFYTPDILRSFGVGTPNGSLWTIAIEVQFYVMVPVLYELCFKQTSKERIRYAWILWVMLCSIGAYVYANSLAEESLVRKVMGVFLLPYLYNFIFGMLIYKHWNLLKELLCNKAGYWLFIYLAYAFLGSTWLGLYAPSYWPNTFGFISNALLSFTVISIAYTLPLTSERWLKGNDFSYGIYIYHMIVVNVLVQMGYTTNRSYLVVVFFFTLLLAIGSWFWIERPALRWKSRG